jgi:hypothetical protein
MDEVSKQGGTGDPVTVGVLIAELIGEEVEDMMGWGMVVSVGGGDCFILLIVQP